MMKQQNNSNQKWFYFTIPLKLELILWTNYVHCMMLREIRDVEVWSFFWSHECGVNSQIIFTSNNIDINVVRRIYLRELSKSLTSEHQQRKALMTNLAPEVRMRSQEATSVVP